MLFGILKSMRPHQWVKNAFVLAPLVFASAFDQLDLVLRALAAFMAFSVTAGGVYLFNDIVDVDKDRAHPTKRNRPVAAGTVSIAAARVAAGIALCVGIGTAFVLSPATGLALTSYLAINVAYSARLKHIAYVDLVVIATGFVIRVLAGGFATGIAISLWLILCTFLLALFLGLGKRRHELLDAQTDTSQTRRVLRQYQAHTLSRTMATTALLTICAYTAYTFSEHGAEVFGTAWAPLSVPFCIFGIVRFHVLTGRTDTSASPTDRMLTDIPFMANLLAWGVLVLVWLSQR